MADLDAKLPRNVPGAFYVDDQCIDCEVCREIAPAHFRQEPVEGFSYVYRQPTSDAERSLAREALEECPVEAIGDDGP